MISESSLSEKVQPIVSGGMSSCDDQSSLQDVDFALTVTHKHTLKGKSMAGKNLKSVSFKETSLDRSTTSYRGLLTRKEVNTIAQEIIQEKLESIGDNLRSLKERQEQVESTLSDAYTCDNIKLLEVVMEHLLFHWEDITDLLIDELIEDEANERNRIEAALQGRARPTVVMGEESVPRKQEHPVREVQSVDMRDIMRIFEDYTKTEMSIRNRL